MRNIKSIYSFLKESKEEEIQDYIDIISMNPSKYEKYIKILKDKYGVDYYSLDKDSELVNDINLSNIYKKEDFTSFENYQEYSINVFKKRGLNIPNNLDKFLTYEECSQVIDLIGDLRLDVISNSSNNHAEFNFGSNTIHIPKEGVDINTFVHELGHYFDYKYNGDKLKYAKTITYSPTSYGMTKSHETIAENFMYFILHPKWLKSNLKEVYLELNKSIPKKLKDILNSL